MERVITWALVTLLLAVASGCRASDPTLSEAIPTGETAMSIELSSSVFTEGERIPVEYTCNGKNISPPLAWKNLPANTQSLALIVDDPDAPAGTWVHWVLYNLPASAEGLAAGSDGLGIQGQNSSRKSGYSGPCPPAGKPHRYFFKLYALDTSLPLDPGASKAELEKAMQGHILGQGQLMGTFSR
jgi:Raf kinase inhibitor-like YbhB/YbcL family protein